MASENARFSPSRRRLMQIATMGTVIAGTSALTTAASATADNTIFPADFSSPAITGPSLALWGSSSFAGARATDGVPLGLDARIESLLTAELNVPVLNFGRGGEFSHNIATRRGVSALTTKLVFPHHMIPASGTVQVSLEQDSPIRWNTATFFPGFIQDIPGVITAVDQAEGSYLFTRMQEGDERYAPAGTPANHFYSYQEMISRSSHHVIQVGRNNLTDVDLIIKHTQQCFDLAPTRTLVMGHFRADGDAPDSERAKNTLAYNEWGAQTYGENFMNTEQWIFEASQDPAYRYGEIADAKVWEKKSDRKAETEKRIPRSLYSSDGLHLNGWGYILMARMLQAKITELGWYQ